MAYLQTLEGLGAIGVGYESPIDEFVAMYENYFYALTDNPNDAGSKIKAVKWAWTDYLDNATGLAQYTTSYDLERSKIQKVKDYILSNFGFTEVREFVTKKYSSWDANVYQKAKAKESASSGSKVSSQYYDSIFPDAIQEEVEAPIQEEVKTQEEAAARGALENVDSVDFQEEKMDENLELPTQLVTSGSEFTVIDEADRTISYVDENGQLYVEEKPKSLIPWIAAAVAAYFIL